MSTQTRKQNFSHGGQVLARSAKNKILPPGRFLPPPGFKMLLFYRSTAWHLYSPNSRTIMYPFVQFCITLWSPEYYSLLRPLPFVVLFIFDSRTINYNVSLCIILFDVLSSLLRLLPFVVPCSPNSRTIYYNVSLCIVLNYSLKSWVVSWRLLLVFRSLYSPN